MTSPGSLETALLPGFCTGLENLRLLKTFAFLCGPRLRGMAFEAWEADGTLDGVWASHVLEHARNPAPRIRPGARMETGSGRLAVTGKPRASQVVARLVRIWR